MQKTGRKKHQETRKNERPRRKTNNTIAGASGNISTEPTVNEVREVNAKQKSLQNMENHIDNGKQHDMSKEIQNASNGVDVRENDISSAQAIEQP